MISCKICHKEFEDDRRLHAHIKAHKMILAEYYQSQFPRLDRWDGSMIRFKNKEQYLSTDFNSRTNLRMWIKNTSKEEAREYCKNLLIARKIKKNIEWTPTQVELRSTLMPPIKTYNDLFEDYYGLCESLGFKNKFKYQEFVCRDGDYTIYSDTREQKPLNFTKKVEIAKLPFGDYYCSLDELVFVERKSINDFVGTLSGGFERFQKEILRAKEAGAYMVVLVEENFNNSMGFQHLPHVFSSKVKVQPEFIWHNVRELIQKYDCLQFLFVDGREESANRIEAIFSSGNYVRNIDLQQCYDEGKL